RRAAVAFRNSSTERQTLSRAPRYSPEPQTRARLAIVHPEAFSNAGVGMKIITADERLKERGGPKLLIIGPSGVGKTSLLRTLNIEMLASTAFVDIEAGDIAGNDLDVASVRPRTWHHC